MGSSRLIVWCPTPSYDGLFHCRYPNGNAPNPAGEILDAVVTDTDTASAALATGIRLAGTPQAQAVGAATLTSGGTPAWNPGWPRLASIAYTNSAYEYATYGWGTSNPILQTLRRFHIVILNLDYENAGSSGRPKNTLFTAVKAGSGNGRPVAAAGTKVGEYFCFDNRLTTSPLTGSSVTLQSGDGAETLARLLAKDNFWMYEAGSSGALATDSSASSGPSAEVCFTVNYSTGAPYAGVDQSGNSAAVLGAKYAYYEYVAGPPSSGNDATLFGSLNQYDAASSCDFIFWDDLLRNPRNSLPGLSPLDGLRAGSSQTEGFDGVLADSISAGHFALFAELQSLSGGKLWNFGNIGDYAVSAGTGVAPYAMQGVLHGGLLESAIGYSSSWDTNGELTGNLATILPRLQSPFAAILDCKWANSIPSGYPTDIYQLARYGIARAAAAHTVFSFEQQLAEYLVDPVSGLTAGPTVASTSVQWFDEYDKCGALSEWMGQPVSGPTGVAGGFTGTVTSTYSGIEFALPSGVVGIEYANALALFNPPSNGVQTVSYAAIGNGQWQTLASSQATVNPTNYYGGKVIGNGSGQQTSFTLGNSTSSRDGILLPRA